ncbi:MAG TPA: carboxylating nicotinate-nucleotide diphosphorylase [Phycisphaerales bacterium]|nr:carboxylating nicotinate-nucleotide diphosphorylase [Phycisphaerales bacterium]HMP36155.1 carboxylating nicotinate-nucleotide diphosphorylase [Phycisphaerales bacterium]
MTTPERPSPTSTARGAGRKAPEAALEGRSDRSSAPSTGLPQLFDAIVDGVALRTLLTLARDEDLGRGGDVTGRLAIPAGFRAVAAVVPRAAGVIAGLAAAPSLLEVFRFEGGFQVRRRDGERCAAGETIAILEGDLRSILALERTLLNVLSRLSGIATATASYVDAVAAAGAEAIVVDTRKTTPGWRTLEKYAVRCGGGSLHRLGLHDAVLLKDNHLAEVPPDGLAAFVSDVAARARAEGFGGVDAVLGGGFVEVEVDTLAQLDAILSLPAESVDIVLLDNMAPEELAEAVRRRGSRRRPLLEASGGVRLESIAQIARSGVDRIAIGALTHSPQALDIGLDIGIDDALDRAGADGGAGPRDHRGRAIDRGAASEERGVASRRGRRSSEEGPDGR